jgi:hypothetical protein
MVSNQSLAGVLACAVLAAGCASNEPVPDEAAPARVDSTAEAVTPGVPADLTATEAAILAGDAGDASAAPISQDVVRPDAPATYTVQRGDTLWDISNVFLRDPWLWPEIWHVNPQVENPHLIFPGDVLALAYGADGSPRVILQQGGAARLSPRLRSSPLDGPIATIPYSAIAAFLSRPSLLAAEQLEGAPHILTFRSDHMIGGSGFEAYVHGADGPTNARYSVYHIGERLRDPDSGDVLGYSGAYTATARIVAPGDPAKAMLSDSARETLEGDRLIAAGDDAPVAFEVRVPTASVDGEIISVVDDTTLIGTYQIVAINRGQRHGLAPGHVLAVDNAGKVVPDKFHDYRDRSRWGEGGRAWWRGGSQGTLELPSERAGTLLVFKTYDRMSYGIIVGAVEPIRVADRIRNP